MYGTGLSKLERDLMKQALILVTALLSIAVLAQQPSLQATVHVDRPGHAIPKTLYGIFFEDINYAADGGLYPELIANRGFDWRTSEPEGWRREWRGNAMEIGRAHV